MAIDIRANVTCSLGTLISGSISDDYLQGSGLVKTRGSAEISGLITPAVGTVVTFSYVKDGVTRNIPRKLRVLSSFADPFRRTTSVELGCKLTYLNDLKESLRWDAFDDPDNSSYTEADAEIITLPIRASSVMAQCLTRLGLTASSIPLTNQFSVAEFDFSAGYVQTMSDLLVSESWFGYLDFNEVLQVRSLAVDAGQGRIYTPDDIVDIGPIGVGQLPGEAVTVSYSTLKLKGEDNREVEPPDPSSPLDREWETSLTTNYSSIGIAYSDPVTQEQETKVYRITTTKLETTAYKNITTPDGPKRVVSSRLITESTSDVAVAGSMVTAYLSNGLPWGDTQVETITREVYSYDDQGNETVRLSTRTGSKIHAYGSVGLPMVFSPTDYVPRPSGTMTLDKVETITTINGNFVKSITTTYGPWLQTIAGQQSIAEASDAFTTSAEVEDFIEYALQGIHLLDTSISTQKTSATSQEAPTAADIINQQQARPEGDPNNSYRVENTSELELALGSATAQRRIELSMSYAPDDRFIKSGDKYYAIKSDAPQKAAKFGRVQNRLLLGNRNGMNIQLAPEKLPPAPFDPIYVKASGLTAHYRTNGNQWAFDSNGIVCSTDALFWAAVGGTGTFWFPVAPGVTTLPAEPPIVDGEMTPTTVVRPYNETAVCKAVVRTQLGVTKFEYALNVLTAVPALVVKTEANVRRVLKIEPPAGAVIVASQVPIVSGGGSVKVPVTATAVATFAPVVSGGNSALVPSTATVLEALTPTQIGRPRTEVAIPSADLAVAGAAPAVATSKLIAVPSKEITVTGHYAIVDRATPSYFGTSGNAAALGGFLITLQWPVNHQANDVALAVIQTSGADSTLSPPTGWASVTGSPITDVASTSGSRLYLWWKRATGSSESNLSVSSISGDNHHFGSLAVFRGCVTTGNPWDVVATDTKTTASTTATLPAVTTTKFNTRLVMFVGRPDDAANTSHFGVPVNANLTGLTEHYEGGTVTGNGGGFVVASGVMATKGDTGTSTMTKAVSTTDTCYTIALRSY